MDADTGAGAGDDDAYPVGPALMWLIYAECGVCGAAAKQPCVDQRFGPHGGRPRRWDSDLDEVAALRSRMRVVMAEMAVQAEMDGYVPPPDAHGMRGGSKWRVPELGAAVFEGGYLCHCGELFVRTAAQGGIEAAQAALVAHEAAAGAGGV